MSIINEVNGKYEFQKQNEADWHLSMDEPVLHKNIKNYLDIREVMDNIYN